MGNPHCRFEGSINPENLPRPLVDSSPNGALDVDGQLEQEPAIRWSVFFGLAFSRSFLHEQVDRLVLQETHRVGILLAQQINRRIGCGRIVADHQGNLRATGSIPRRSSRAALIPFVLLYRELKLSERWEGVNSPGGVAARRPSTQK